MSTQPLNITLLPVWAPELIRIGILVRAIAIPFGIKPERPPICYAQKSQKSESARTLVSKHLKGHKKFKPPYRKSAHFTSTAPTYARSSRHGASKAMAALPTINSIK